MAYVLCASLKTMHVQMDRVKKTKIKNKSISDEKNMWNAVKKSLENILLTTFKNQVFDSLFIILLAKTHIVTPRV